MTRELERRTITASLAEVRETTGVTSSRRTLSGFAARFDTPALVSSRGTRVREVIRRGAFAESLRSSDQLALWNHNSDFPLGRRSAGTLVLRETPLGLAFALEVPNSPVGDLALEAVRRGDVRGMSFGFIVPPGGEVLRQVGGITTRELVRVDLEEVSPVTFPAYDSTSVTVEPRSPKESPEAKTRRLGLEVSVDRVSEGRGLGWQLDYTHRLKRLAELGG